MLMIIAISVLAYLIVGIAVAAMVILLHGEPKEDDQWIIVFVVLFWWIVLLVESPFFLARWIKARRAASREKPRVYAEEYDEP